MLRDIRETAFTIALTGILALLVGSYVAPLALGSFAKVADAMAVVDGKGN